MATASARAGPLTFVDLPSETQHGIFAHCSQADLICLALVCKHFHKVASAHIYRNFHIVFPDEEDDEFYSSIDGLAVGLDTFATSEYNYAAHLRDFLMDTLSSGREAEHAYQPYLYSASCGKFLNTLVLLTLKRAHSLESFRWNIRVELSRPVYAQLHRLKTLKTLHLRIQSGESYYLNPPPLPVTPAHHQYHDVASSPPPPQPQPPPPPVIITTAIPFPSLVGPPPPLPVLHPPKPKPRPRRVGSGPGPPTLSGFKGLKALAVLDIDCLDTVAELSKCIKSSSATLREMQLSFSESLAQRARRPVPDSDSSDSEPEDFADNYENTGPARAYRAQEERKAQEHVLGDLFGVSVHKMEKPLRAKRPLQSVPPTVQEAPQDPRGEFVASIKAASANIMKFLSASNSLPGFHQETLDIIERAAKKYVDEGSDHADDEKPVPEAPPAEVAPKRKGKGEESPEDIDIAHLETVHDNPDQFDETEPANAPEPTEDEIQTSETKPSHQTSPTQDEPPSTSGASKVMHLPYLEEARHCYVRRTRGVALRVLKICLVPVKAPVLLCAFDVTTIRDLTLLNVGNQAAIWTSLAAVHAETPLALRSVYTDHVSPAFLTCMAALPELDDLFMLERNPKHKPETFAPSSGVSMDQIRRTVLKKHMHRLKRLMIKDESRAGWDVNEKTMIQICTRGEKLQELALSMNIHAVHAFMQYFPNLTNLRAINILHFRNHDTCSWVMREIMRFMVDNVSHHPELKLEWIAMEDNRVDHIVPADQPAPDTKKIPKKEKDKVQSDEYPLMPTLDTDTESDEEPPGARLRVKTVGPLPFYDVWGVKIFEKEIRSGTL